MGNGSEQINAGSILTVVKGEENKQYTVEDLQTLPQVESTFSDINYVGVPLSALLTDAGVDAQGLKAVKAVASDGYSVNCEPALILRDDVILAYAQADGPLASDDGTFRMVLPGEEGKLNVRMIVEIQAIP